ncbi:MAG: VanW family protein [Thermoleophilia bacterium]
MRLPRPRRPGAVLAAGAAVAVLSALAAVVATRVLTAPADRIPAGTAIAGIEVGGLAPEAAERLVRERAEPPGRAVVAELPGREGFPMRIPVARLAPTPRARIAVERAMERPSLWSRVLSEVGLRDARREIALDYRVTPARVAEVVDRVAARVDTEPRSATVVVRGGRPVPVAARAGTRVARDELRGLLRGLPDRLTVPVESVPPAIGDEAARAALTRALRLTRRRAVVRGAGRSAVVPRAVLVDALRVRAEGGALAVSLDPAAVAAAVAPAFEGVTREPVSATFRVEGSRVAVVPGGEGRAIDASAVARAIEADPGGAVRVRIATVAPERTTADANRMRIRELVSEFTTPYACCQPRVTNIRRAAAILDGRIISAGGTFSLNDALGERTKARGFVEAPQINAGRLEDAVGGGVSQMATTFFNASFFAGLRLVTHTPHEFWITRYPAGREATVSWGGPELVVENDWPAAILLKVSAGDTGVTVRMYSAKLGRRVTTETTGTPRAGQAFEVAYTRKVWEGSALRRDERYTWKYKAPPEDG